VKEFLQNWGSTLFHGFVIFGLGTIVIVQNIQNATIQLKLQGEIVDVYHFNGQLSTDNAVKEFKIEQMEEVLEQQLELLNEMYRELQQFKRLFPLPEARPNRSDA
jgi:hypothetical protein